MHPHHEAEPSLRSLLLLLRRRQRLILGVVLAGTGLVVVAGLQMAPEYTATASVMLESRPSRVVDVETVLAALPADLATIETQMKLLRSPVRIERVVRDLQLDTDREFNPQLEDDERSRVAMTVTPFWQGLLRWMPDGWLVATGVAQERELVPTETAEADRVAATTRAVLDRVKVRQDGNSLVIAVDVTAGRPDKAARIANSIAELYVSDSLDAKRGATDRAGSWLTGRVGALQAELADAEADIERFRSANNLLSVDDGTASNLELADLNRDLLAARTDLAQRQGRLGLIRDLAKRGESLETVPEIMGSPLFVELWREQSDLSRSESDLRSRFGDKHPQVQAIVVAREDLRQKMTGEVARLVRNLESEAQVAALKLATLDGELKRARGSNSTSRKAEVQLRELERRAEAVRHLYESFLQRQQETREQNEIIEPDARVIVRAAPPTRPSSPGTLFFTALGITVSSLAASCLVYALERLDRGVRSGKQVELEFGVPCLGLVPLLDRRTLRRGRRPHAYLLAKPLSTYAETVGSVCTALRLTNIDRPPRVLQVTSAVPGEGKTVFAVSLAASLRHAGHATLLVDLDLRHPSVPREIAPPRGGGGLVRYLAGEIGTEALIERDEASGLDLIAVRELSPNPAALIASERMRSLMEELRRRYDFIVIDSAPILGVRDSKLVTQLVDACLLVIRWESTTRDTVGDALKELVEIRAPLAGVVVTQVDLARHARYGYGGIDGYYTKYRRYYVD